MREWHFQERVYKRWVVLMIGTYEEFIAAMQKAKYKDVDELVRSGGYNIRLTYDNSDCTMTVVWLPQFSGATLAHELVHLTMNVFDNAGVPIHYENEEGFAYYLEYWFREISRVYKKYPNGRTAAEAKK
jgi:hypothetical protein